MDMIRKLEKIGYQIEVEGDNVRVRYLLPGDPPEEKVKPLLVKLRHHKAEAIDYLRLLQTPQSEIEKPVCIESNILGERLYLVANEEQAREIEQGDKVCYLPGEIGALLTNSARMDEETLKGYLTKVHQIKKTFEVSRIQKS